ncbi:MAG: DUF1565 domain-containing protein [Candidatus Acidiferrales bacterium]
MLLAICGFAIRSVAAFPSSNTDRYVSPDGDDSNDGTRHHPWATITHAGSVATPGTTIHVAPGAYNAAAVTTANGTPVARITYISDRSWGAVIAPIVTTTFAWRNTGSYTDIVGFEIAGTQCNGIGLGGSFQRAISNNVHNSAAGCNNNTGGSGINDFNYSSRENDVIGNYVHDVGIGDLTCGAPQHDFVQGIYQSNAGGHIDRNISANNCGWGIHLWHGATHAIVTNNTVVANRGGGVVIGSGDSPCGTTGCPGGNDFTVVRNNIIAFNGGWGLREEAQDPGQTGIHNVYSNNLSFRNAAGDFLLSHNLACVNCISGKDPRFVSASSGDYHLSADSPAIGAGKLLEKAEIPAAGPTVSKHASSGSIDIGALAVASASPQ